MEKILTILMILYSNPVMEIVDDKVTINPGTEVVIDMRELYGIMTVLECEKMIPRMLKEYDSLHGFCAYGDITKRLYES